MGIIRQMGIEEKKMIIIKLKAYAALGKEIKSSLDLNRPFESLI